MNKEIKTQKQALKEPLGTYYHPTKNTYRTGICEVGKILKKGHSKKIQTKSGKKEIYMDPVCIKNKGKPGITINSKNDSKIKENLRMEKYIKDIKKSSYRSVIMKLRSQLKKENLSNSQKNQLKKDIELLQKWRINNPSDPKKNKKQINKSNENDQVTNKPKLKTILNNKSNIHNEKIFNSSIKEFQKNLETDFLPKHNQEKQKNNKIKQLSTKEILNLIKDN